MYEYWESEMVRYRLYLHDMGRDLIVHKQSRKFT